MRQINIAATNKQAAQTILELARKYLTNLMATQPTGEWFCVVRWGLGTIDHLEPQFSGRDLPSTETGLMPTSQDLKRVEHAILQATDLGLRTHPYGRLQLRIPWTDGRVGDIQHIVSASVKIDPVLTRD